jgi:hypothetical protein
MNWVFPSATGSLGVEFDGMCWLLSIHVEIMGSDFEKLPWPPFQISILWLPSEVLYSGMQIDWKPWPVELQHQCNSIMHHVSPFPKLDENLSHDESQEIWGNTATFSLQRIDYSKAKNLAILEKLRCVSSYASKETRELLQISMMWYSVRKMLRSSANLGTLNSTATSAWELLQWNSGIKTSTVICIQDYLGIWKLPKHLISLQCA